MNGPSRARWSIADQAVSSLGNFLLVYLVVSTSSIEDAGVFGFVYATYFLLMFLVRGLAMDPLVVRFAGVDIGSWRAATGDAVGAAVAVAVTAAAVVGAAGAIVGSSLGAGLAVLAIVLPGLLVQDAWRMAFFCRGRPVDAFRNDVVFLAVQAAGFVALALAGSLDMILLLAVWGIGGYVGTALGGFQAGVPPRLRRAWSWLRENRHTGPAYAGDYLANRGAEQLAMVVISSLGGLGALGAVTTCRTLFAPLAATQTGLVSFALPESARLVAQGRFGRMRRLVWSCAVGVGLLMAIAGAILAWVPDGLGTTVFGGNWSPAGGLIVPMTVFSVVNALGFGIWVGLRGMQLAKDTFVTRVLSGVVFVIATGVGVLGWGAAGAVWGMTAGALVQAVWFAVVFERRHGRGAAHLTRAESSDAR